ncbi:hypothetical protein L8R80_10445 [Vibrio splendidus]|uniref:hypothetical protein n=1 Tax=Vibrio splendidus TaxID=29497 RepID=UPI00246924A8|nr:hypothetical protein [Vibrio splendidus]MDH5913638.1 hypothetical protein [Vibrio splendidus]MDH5941694.1 hypothetical protein [Vibrio splendidus]MDH5987264.1 hypothetical protein [Vibrio splendidus]MDH5993658.1 hypothetical protein [Vibrio splendidus]MDH6007056.1 hypothetical protein [Vibrio splendidus]
MIKEYAVDPNAYTRNLDSLQRFFIDFRAENGRVVAAIPRNWQREQQNLIRAMGLQTIQKQKCFDEISKIVKHSLISGTTIPTELDGWIEQARYVKQQLGLEAIITCVDDFPNGEFDYSNILFVNPSNWNIENSISVRRQAIDMANAISSSLSIAEVCMFVDPYFDPGKDRFKNVLIEFITKLSNGRRRCRKAYLHTAIHRDAIDKNRTRTDIENALQQNIQPLLPEGFVLETWFWPENKMHDRFVLTKQVGYSFGHGLDEAASRDAIQVNINRIAETARETEYRKLSNSALRTGDPIVIIGE